MTQSSYEVVGQGVAIYKQKTSKFWWCSVTVENEGKKEYIRKSTKKTDRLEAIEIAIQVKLELKIKKDNNIPIIDNAPTFRKICKLLIEEFDKKERQRSTYKTYKLHWNRMIEFYSNKRIDNITSFNIIEYFDKYKISSKTQITTTRTSFKKVYEYALYRNLIRKMDIPEIPNIEKKEEISRDYFKNNDIEVFFNIENRRDFIENSRKKLTEKIRFIFFFYCDFILKTGVRAGTEINNLRYKDFYFDKKGTNTQAEKSLIDIPSQLYVKINEGKVSEKNKRVIPLSYEVQENLLYYCSEIDIDFFEKVKEKSDLYLFRNNGIKEINFIDTYKQYKEFLIEKRSYDLENKTLYSFRHTYITEKLLKGIDIHLIARATGTSSAMIDKHYSHLQAIMKKEELISI